MVYPKATYAVYKGESLLVTGTIEQIANELNVKPQTVRFWQTPCYLKRNEKSKTGNYKVTVRVD